MRICSGPGCLRAVRDAVRFCDECQPVIVTTPCDERYHTTGYDAVLDALRKGTRWQRIRDIAIKRCPLCARCELSISEIVDHIVPAAIAIQQAQGSGRYPFDKYAGYYLLSNLQGLCRACHYAKTVEDKTHTGPWPSVVENERRTHKRVWTF